MTSLPTQRPQLTRLQWERLSRLAGVRIPDDVDSLPEEDSPSSSNAASVATDDLGRLSDLEAAPDAGEEDGDYFTERELASFRDESEEAAFSAGWEEGNIRPTTSSGQNGAVDGWDEDELPPPYEEIEAPFSPRAVTPVDEPAPPTQHLNADDIITFAAFLDGNVTEQERLVAAVENIARSDMDQGTKDSQLLSAIYNLGQIEDLPAGLRGRLLGCLKEIKDNGHWIEAVRGVGGKPATSDNPDLPGQLLDRLGGLEQDSNIAVASRSWAISACAGTQVFGRDQLDRLLGYADGLPEGFHKTEALNSVRQNWPAGRPTYQERLTALQRRPVPPIGAEQPAAPLAGPVPPTNAVRPATPLVGPVPPVPGKSPQESRQEILAACQSLRPRDVDGHVAAIEQIARDHKDEQPKDIWLRDTINALSQKGLVPDHQRRLLHCLKEIKDDRIWGTSIYELRGKIAAVDDLEFHQEVLRRLEKMSKKIGDASVSSSTAFAIMGYANAKGGTFKLEEWQHLLSCADKLPEYNKTQAMKTIEQGWPQGEPTYVQHLAAIRGQPIPPAGKMEFTQIQRACYQLPAGDVTEQRRIATAVEIFADSNDGSMLTDTQLRLQRDTQLQMVLLPLGGRDDLEPDVRRRLFDCLEKIKSDQVWASTMYSIGDKVAAHGSPELHGQVRGRIEGMMESGDSTVISLAKLAKNKCPI